MTIKITISDSTINHIYGEFTTAKLTTDDILSGLLMCCKFRYDKKGKVMPHFEISPCRNQEK